MSTELRRGTQGEGLGRPFQRPRTDTGARGQARGHGAAGAPGLVPRIGREDGARGAGAKGHPSDEIDSEVARSCRINLPRNGIAQDMPLCSKPLSTSRNARWLFSISVPRYCRTGVSWGCPDGPMDAHLLFGRELGRFLPRRLLLCPERCLDRRPRLEHEPGRSCQSTTSSGGGSAHILPTPRYNLTGSPDRGSPSSSLSVSAVCFVSCSRAADSALAFASSRVVSRACCWSWVRIWPSRSSARREGWAREGLAHVADVVVDLHRHGWTPASGTARPDRGLEPRRRTG